MEGVFFYPAYPTGIERNPIYANAYSARGTIKQSLGNIAGAMLDYDAAIRNDPACWEAYQYRASLKEKQGDHQGAVEDMQKANANKPASLRDEKGMGRPVRIRKRE